MSYFRLYPQKNNTIFRNKDEVTSAYTFPISETQLNTNIPQSQKWSILANSGANPIMELQDGKGESRLLFGFQLPVWLKNKLTLNDFTCSLKLYDSGTLFNPPIKLKNIRLSYFTDDFSEGDGYSFLSPKALTPSVSNFVYRNSVNTWEATVFTTVVDYHLNSINEDLTFDVSNSITSSITNSLDPKFCLHIVNQETNYDNILTKYIHSSYTKTVFKPYLEFQIEDSITDNSYNLIGGTLNRVYLVNQRGIDFSGTVTADLLNNAGSPITTTVIKQADGIYYFAITPSIPSYLKEEYVTVTWKIGGNAIEKRILKVKNPDLVQEEYDSKNLFFFPTTGYTHNIIRQGDVVQFDITSQIRGKGNIVINNYEYKVVSMDGFVMNPWTKVSTYKDKMYFSINTEYYFPELQYEIFVRFNNSIETITSSNSYKFKLIQDAQSHLRDLASTPYFSRDQFLSK